MLQGVFLSEMGRVLPFDQHLGEAYGIGLVHDFLPEETDIGAGIEMA